MKIAIIGAGGAGLSAARHCFEHELNFQVYEQTEKIGGTWNYTDNIGLDDYQLPIHSSMYQGLRTNIPKEVMNYEGFPYPEKPQSYIMQTEVLEYLNHFAKAFNLLPHINFLTLITKVLPLNDGWLIDIENVKDKIKKTVFFDAVFICNGHYKVPFIPEISGLETFQGSFKHSHVYRKAESYKDKIVLVVGAGPSGCDISRQILDVAKNVYLSHNGQKLKGIIDEKIIQKPGMIKINEKRVYFKDNTNVDIDDILFCTGYEYSFPFLDNSCKISIDNNFVYPLYKHIVNIEYPTMAFIGIPFKICPFPMFDIQVRYFIAFLTKQFKIPTKIDMMNELNEEINKNKNQGILKKYYHQIGNKQADYFNQLADMAKIKKIPSVINKIYMDVMINRNINNYFKIIDNENFKLIY